MTVLDTLAKQAGRLATDVQTSLRRARVEGERRLLQRQHLLNKSNASLNPLSSVDERGIRHSAKLSNSGMAFL